MPGVNRRGFFTSCALGGAVAAQPAVRAAQPATPRAAGSAGSAATTPEQRLRAMLNGAAVTQMVSLVARYGIPDQLAAGPKPVAALAAASGVHADALYRVMRCLAGLGVFHEEDGRRFRQSELSALLTTGTPRSLRAQGIMRGEDYYWRSFGALRESVRTGQTGFHIAYGQNTFDWFKDHPEAARLFDEAMAEMTTAAASAIAAAYPFGSVKTIADVGGGNGALLRAVLATHAGTTAWLFDLPHVVEAARPHLTKLAGRLQLKGGDFFVEVPAGADLYLMKYILHDWEDARAREILANVKRAMQDGARLLVIEDLICAPNVACQAKVGDVTMLARTGGRNLTEAEYRDLLKRGGFTVTRVIPAAGDLHILECTPA